jgi:hypothetical protein
MPKTKTKLRELEVDDPDGIDWHAKAGAKWDLASVLAAAAGPEAAPIEYYEPHPLPDFRAGAPAPGTRPDGYGRFLQERSTGIVHDVYAATPACKIDDIRDGTYYHFWSELVEAAGEDIPCRFCLGA